MVLERKNPIRFSRLRHLERMQADRSSDLDRLFRAVAAGHLLTYYREEGHFGALTPVAPENIDPVIDRLAAGLEMVVESFLAFEHGEPLSVFDLLAREIVGLPATSAAGDQSDAAESPALVREAARLEIRLQEFAAEAMYAGLNDLQLAPPASAADQVG